MAYSNGEIPFSALKAVGVSPVLREMQYLTIYAANAYLALDAKFYAAFGFHLDITEGYRSLARQKQLYYAYQNDPKNNPLAAYPGTSNHGWGMAADFGSGAATSGSATSLWLRKYGGAYGYDDTGYRFSKVEPWHYDFVPGMVTASLEVTPINYEEEDSMSQVRYLYKEEGGVAYGIFGQEIPGGSRISTSVNTAEVWGAIWGTAPGAPWKKMTAAQWTRLIAEAKVVNEAWVAQQKAIASAAGSAAPLTAAQLTAAVKAALPKSFNTTTTMG